MSRLDLSGDRQLQEERGAGAAVGVDPDAAVHPRHELPRDVEAEARPAHPARQVRVEAEELLEDPVLLCGRNAEPLVGDAEPDATATAADLDLDVAPVERVLDRVVDQVREDLAQLVRIRGDLRQAP